jgi:hypothetical protein
MFVLIRFWTCVGLFVIMAVTWKLELQSWQTSGPHVSVLEIIKCLSVALMFMILVLNEKVRALIGLASGSKTIQELSFDGPFNGIDV